MHKKGKTYRILENQRLVIICYLGEVALDDIKDMMKSVSRDSDYSPEFDVINDFRDCDLQPDIDAIPDYVNFLKNELKIVANRKIVFLTSKPNEVVITNLFSDEVINSPIKGHAFTTMEASLAWLPKKNIHFLKIENIISEMKVEIEKGLQ